MYKLIVLLMLFASSVFSQGWGLGWASGAYAKLSRDNTFTGANTFSGTVTFSSTVTFSGLVQSTFTVTDAMGGIIRIESSDLTLSNNNQLGFIDFYSNDASSGATGIKSSIRSIAEVSFGSGDQKTGLQFFITETTALVEAMRLNYLGNLLLGIATAVDQQTPEFIITVDAESNNGTPVTEAFKISSTQNDDPTLSTWGFTSTQGAGYFFDKTVNIGAATAVDTQSPDLIITNDADSDGAAQTTEALTISLTANADPTLATWGFTSTQGAGYTFDKTVLISSLTASEIVITDANKNLVSAAVATYPSLAELIHVKGVTSAIQTQIDAQEAELTNSAGLLAALDDETGTGVAVFGTSPTFTTALGIGAATAVDQQLPNFVITADAESNNGTPVTEALTISVAQNDDPTLSTWGFATTQGVGYTFDKKITVTGVVNSKNTETLSKSFTIVSAITDDDFLLWKVKEAITITSINGVLLSGTNVVGGLDETDSNGANPAAVDSDITFDGGNDADDGSLTNPTIDANDWVKWHTTSVSSPGYLTITINYTVD